MPCVIATKAWFDRQGRFTGASLQRLFELAARHRTVDLSTLEPSQALKTLNVISAHEISIQVTSNTGDTAVRRGILTLGGYVPQPVIRIPDSFAEKSVK